MALSPRCMASLMALAVVALTEVSTFSILPTLSQRTSTTTLGMFSFDDERRRLEFRDLEPLPEPEARRQRLAQDNQIKSRFVPFGDDLWDLRDELDSLSHRLVEAVTQGREEDMTRDRLRQVESKDPELVYMLELAEVEMATREGRMEDAAAHRDAAMEARSCLPHFNLEGLWVGKYGSHGYEMINVTYVGDTLIATKVTGDQNVPRGEITFQADLHPLHYTESSPENSLKPIKLTDKAAQKWGTRQLPRYAGKGQVADKGFRDNQWMDGQLIIIGDEYFSFAWIPVETQIFFGRPSPELALKMLRDGGEMGLRAGKSFEAPPSMDDNINLQKDFAAKCLEMSHEYHEEDVSLGCIWDSDDTEECYFE